MTSSTGGPTWTLLLTAAVLCAVGVFLLLERNLTRVLIGVVMLGNGANLLLLTVGGRAGGAPVLGITPPSRMNDPLPQAMMLTAIVITLAMTAFVLAMIHRTWQISGDDDIEDDAEDLRVIRRSERADLRAGYRVIRRELRAQARRRGRLMRERMAAEHTLFQTERRRMEESAEHPGVDPVGRREIRARLRTRRRALRERMRELRAEDRAQRAELRAHLREARRELRRRAWAERALLARADLFTEDDHVPDTEFPGGPEAATRRRHRPGRREGRQAGGEEAGGTRRPTARPRPHRRGDTEGSGDGGTGDGGTGQGRTRDGANGAGNGGGDADDGHPPGDHDGGPGARG